MDTEDKWYHKYFPEYYKIYKAEAEVKNVIFVKIDKLLHGIVRGTNVVSLGHLTKKSRVNVRGSNDMAGVVSFDHGDGGGHWFAIYYKAATDTLWAYESSQQVQRETRRSVKVSSDFTELMKDTIRAIFGDLYDISIVGSSSIIYPEDAVKFAKCRPGEECRQPYRFGYQLLVDSLVKRDEEPTPDQTRKILSYAWQHQFCYVEALMFLDEYIHKRPHHACICTRSALMRVKAFVKTLDLKLKSTVYEQFMRIMNPETGRVNCV